MRRMSMMLIVLALVACRREQKRVLRTEPWLASASASPSAERSMSGGRYVVTHGRATIELRVDGHPASATVSRFDGSLELDFREPAKTRARLKADLLSLVFDGDGDDASLRARAFERLGLTPDSAETASERFAELVINALELGTGGGQRRGTAVAQGELTLHRFRIPVLLDLEVELGGDAAEPDRLTARTRRPIVISLSAHDLGPETSAARRDQPGRSRSDVGKEARVSAEIVARPMSGSTPR